MEKDVETYLTGEMTGAARADFEKKLAADPALREALENERKILDGFQFLRIRQRVGVATVANRHIRNKRVLGSAFLVLGATGLAAWLFFKNGNEAKTSPPGIWQPKTEGPKTPETDLKKTSPGPLPPHPAEKPKPPVAEKFRSDPKTRAISRNQYALALDFHRLPGGFGAMRGDLESTAPASDLEKAEAEFEAGKYKNCISILGKLENSTPPGEAEKMLLLRAHAYFLDGQTGLAERDFAVLSEKNGSGFQANAEWHRLLCHLVNRPEDRTGLQKMLKPILENGAHPFNGLAREFVRRYAGF